MQKTGNTISWSQNWDILSFHPCRKDMEKSSIPRYPCSFLKFTTFFYDGITVSLLIFPETGICHV
ncbi:MAG: hypothetical protein A4E38_00072 [Methanoregulaceae archaeon PtaB.Bin108]|nr:MAG: hypothetical protein A4E38_00072 [Methanoregulaceae archaeon PtaB.Bin108]